jgi:hypothetical protein
VRNNDLGELQAVELRSQWPNEASDFTPSALPQTRGLEIGTSGMGHSGVV